MAAPGIIFYAIDKVSQITHCFLTVLLLECFVLNQFVDIFCLGNVSSSNKSLFYASLYWYMSITSCFQLISRHTQTHIDLH